MGFLRLGELVLVAAWTSCRSIELLCNKNCSKSNTSI